MMLPADRAGRALTTAELRRAKPDRAHFPSMPRRKVQVVLDRVHRYGNLGQIFRLCDAMLVERLVICGPPVALHKRKLVQAARGTQKWVPWEWVADTAAAVAAAREAGFAIVVAELTEFSIRPDELACDGPICLVFGDDGDGVAPAIVAMADQTVAVPMLGMGNSLNVATAAAILLYHAVWAAERCVPI